MTALRERFPHQLDERKDPAMLEDLEFVTKRMDSFLASDHEHKHNRDFCLPFHLLSSVFSF
jgi:hypothetical protein